MFSKLQMRRLLAPLNELALLDAVLAGNAPVGEDTLQIADAHLAVVDVGGVDFDGNSHGAYFRRL